MNTLIRAERKVKREASKMEEHALRVFEGDAETGRKIVDELIVAFPELQRFRECFRPMPTPFFKDGSPLLYHLKVLPAQALRSASAASSINPRTAVAKALRGRIQAGMDCLHEEIPDERVAELEAGEVPLRRCARLKLCVCKVGTRYVWRLGLNVETVLKHT